MQKILGAEGGRLSLRVVGFNGASDAVKGLVFRIGSVSPIVKGA